MTDYDYDGAGNTTQVDVSGGNVASRRSTASGFGSAGNGYPTSLVNAEDHTQSAIWDVGLGVPTSLTDANCCSAH